MAMREIRLGLHDEAGGRHWAWGKCWCETSHAGQEEAPPRLVAPPWAESRDGETVAPAVTG